MREVHDLHHAEDERQARGDECEDEADEQSRDERLREDRSAHLPQGGSGQRTSVEARSNG